MRYPRDQMEFENTFSNEESCIQYLIEVKWPNGYTCNKCLHTDYWVLSRKRLKCKSCSSIATLTSKTFFDQSNKPLSLWFRAIWWMIAQKHGVSASGLQSILGIGSYKTAWIWLHKIRGLMVFPNREKLSGKVEVDETFVGGAAEGKRGRGSTNKTLVVIAIEVLPKGTGRVRLGIVPNATGKSLLKFVRANIEPGSTIITDGWKGYAQLKRLLYSIATSVPFVPNISRLSNRIEVSRPYLIKALNILEKSQLIRQLYKSNKGISYLSKPDKIYLNNTNLIHTLAGANAEKGNLRETFFLNQISVRHDVKLPPAGDFFVDEKFIFEIGGKSKSANQLCGQENSFIVKDDIEIGARHCIPLWMFGFLY